MNETAPPVSTARKSAVNIGTLERVGSATLGILLLLKGLKRRSIVGTAVAFAGGKLLYRGVSGHSRLYGAVGASTANEEKDDGVVDVHPSITIAKSPDELYRAWKDPENLTRIVAHFAEVTASGEARTHWSVKNPFGKNIEWEAQVVEDRPGEFLHWQSNPGAPWPNDGSVSFSPGPAEWSTVVTLQFRFDPPGGDVSGLVLRRLRFVPRTLATKALRRFKSLMEAGEIPTLRNNSAARTGALANAF